MQRQANLPKERLNPQSLSSADRKSKRSYPPDQESSTKSQANAGKKPKLECGSDDTIAVPAQLLMDIVAKMDQAFDDVRFLDTAFSGAKRRALMPLDEARKALTGLLVGEEPAQISDVLGGASSKSQISASVATVASAGSQLHPTGPRAFKLTKLSRGPSKSGTKQEPSNLLPVATAAANKKPPSRKQHAPATAASESDYCHAWMTLLEYCVKERCAFPTLTYEESGPSHERQYLCTLTLNDAVYRPPHQSQTKKVARREASVVALRAVLET